MAARLLLAVMSEVMGGAEGHALDLAARLDQRGHDVGLLVRPGPHPVGRAARATGLSVRDAGTYPEVAAVIDAVKPDIVQHFDAQVVIAGLEVASHRAASVQVIHANHALQPHLRATPVEDADVVIAVSDSAARFAPLGGPPARVIYSGVDTERFHPSRSGPEGGERGVTQVLCAGRIDEAAKRCSAVRAACQALPDDRWRLTFIGDGPDAAALAEALTSQEELRPQVPDLGKVYRGFDVLVSASLSEGFGQVLAEAAASGLAIVARRCHGLSELLQDGRHALLADDDEGLAAQLARVHTDAVLRAALGARARRFAQTQLSMSVMVDGYEAAHRAALEVPR